ncbi:MAG: SPOR domain-containing protein [Pseudomonadales bacterium]
MIRVIMLVLLLVPASSLPADFQSGVEAYRSHDFPRAYAEFKELAEAGNERAQTALALMYKFGEAVDKDLQTSFLWYEKAAQAGYTPAQYNLALMYLEGNGTKQNQQAAIHWLKKAADGGFERARSKLRELNQDYALSGEKRPDSPSIWSRAWNFHLPDDVRYGSATSPAADTKYHVQLGAMATREGANRLWEWLQLETGELFTGLNPRIKTSGKQSLYKVQTGPFANAREAEAFCEELIQQKSDAQCHPLNLD